MINFATKGMFPGDPSGISTMGKFKQSLIRRIIQSTKKYIARTVLYLLTGRKK